MPEPPLYPPDLARFLALVTLVTTSSVIPPARKKKKAVCPGSRVGVPDTVTISMENTSETSPSGTIPTFDP